MLSGGTISEGTICTTTPLLVGDSMEGQDRRQWHAPVQPTLGTENIYYGS